MLACVCDVSPQTSTASSAQGDSHLMLRFPIEAGGNPQQFRLDMNKEGYIASVSVFAADSPTPIQTLASCAAGDETYAEFQQQTNDPILKHADLNLDGFEDLELLYLFVPHLGKRLYCVYLWDAKTGQFRYSQEVTEVATNLEAQPGSQTLTTHEDGCSARGRTAHIVGARANFS